MSISVTSRRRDEGHGHLEVVDLLHRRPEVDLQSSRLAAERTLLAAPVATVRDHAWRGTADVPGDQPGAFAGVGRRELLPDQGVEQRRLPGLDPSRDGQAQWFGQPPPGVVQLGPGQGITRPVRGHPHQ